MRSALWNAAIWLTPPPIHLISLFLPFFSGYSIASKRAEKGIWSCVQIALVMGATLGTLALIAGALRVLVTALMVPVDFRLAFVIVLAVGSGIGAYTSLAALIGAGVALGRASQRQKEAVSPPDVRVDA